MTGYLNGGAHAIAHGGANGGRAGTVHAKTREGTTQHHTGPHRKFLGVETSHHVVQIGDGGPATDMMTDLDIIEALDFTPELPCDGVTEDHGCRFDQAAELVVEVVHSGNRYLVCKPCWAWIGKGVSGCDVDPRGYDTRDEHYRIIRVLR